MKFPDRHSERGQTIVLVALTVVTMLAMAALAIDVVTLYVARTEMQRAADGAALAAAKAFVDSGVTTDPTNSARQTLATDMATALINTTMQQNKIGGVQPSLVGTPTPDFTRNGNPQITVTLQRTDLPMFFARIWGSRAMTVTASATAEAYNPSGTASYPPLAPMCVKPLLVANKNPNNGGLPFVTLGSGAVDTTIIGQSLVLTQGCTGGGPTTCVQSKLPVPLPAGSFIAAEVPTPPTACPSCSGASNFEQAVECCDYQVYGCGGTARATDVNIGLSHSQMRNQTGNGIQCLIHGPATQDTIDTSDLLAGIGPAKITANTGPQSGNLVTTSSSLATLPIFDSSITIDTANSGPWKVRVIGLLQLFIDSETIAGGGGPPNAQITAHVLNVIGCGDAPGGSAPVVGSALTGQAAGVTQKAAASPIPVRLIH